MSEPLIVDYVAEVVFDLVPGERRFVHLDMGAGWGHFIQHLRTRLPHLKSCALDYNPSHFPLADVPIAHADFNCDRLPFRDAQFDLVTCTEVFEHLENFRHATREAARVLKPGGLFVVSTPNVLSLKSRWAYLTRGFFTYFDPLPPKDDTNIYPGQRHITAIPFFYLAHALLDAGLTKVQVRADKTQRSSAFWALLLKPCLRLAVRHSFRRRRRRFFALSNEIERLAELNNSWSVLTGRTLILCAFKRGLPS